MSLGIYVLLCSLIGCYCRRQSLGSVACMQNSDTVRLRACCTAGLPLAFWCMSWSRVSGVCLYHLCMP